MADGGEVFGVAAEGDAGIVDDAFVQRGGYHAGKFALADAAVGAVEQGEYVVGIGGVELAGVTGSGEGDV